MTAADIATLATSAASGTNGSTWTEAATRTAAAEDVTLGKASTVGETISEDANGNTQAEWSKSYSDSYNASVAALTTGGSNSSESDVSVEGIGNIANVGVQSSTAFSVEVGSRIPDTIAPENGTGSGGAGMNLSTTSSAAVSSSQFASAFIQSFAGEVPQQLIDANAAILTGGTTD